MSETKKLKSLTLIHGGSEQPKLSVCLTTGEHWFLEFGGPAQVALLSEECAAYAASQIRKAETRS